MQIFHDRKGFPEAARGAVFAIGNFDGVHLGHQTVIGEAGRLAREAGALHGVLTFEPHPRSVFRADSPPFRLTPFPAKARLVEALGVGVLVALRFDRAFAQTTAEDFVARVLGEGLGARHVVAGYDFVFGHKRQGTPDRLVALAREQGIGATILAPIEGADEEVISATSIREHLLRADPRAATRLLGRPWEIEGPVEEGDRIGRTLGFPTANIALGEHLRPATGVYAVRVDGTLPGVASFGWRPAVGGKDLRFEVHLLDFSGDLYGKTLRVALVDYLRPEENFESLDLLKAAIESDAQQARSLLLR